MSTTDSTPPKLEMSIVSEASMESPPKLRQWVFRRTQMELQLSNGESVLVTANVDNVLKVVKTMAPEEKLIMVFNELEFHLPIGLKHWWASFTSPVRVLVLCGSLSAMDLIMVTKNCCRLTTLVSFLVTVYEPYLLSDCFTKSLKNLYLDLRYSPGITLMEASSALSTFFPVKSLETIQLILQSPGGSTLPLVPTIKWITDRLIQSNENIAKLYFLVPEDLYLQQLQRLGFILCTTVVISNRFGAPEAYNVFTGSFYGHHFHIGFRCRLNCNEPSISLNDILDF